MIIDNWMILRGPGPSPAMSIQSPAESCWSFFGGDGHRELDDVNSNDDAKHPVNPQEWFNGRIISWRKTDD